MSRFDYAARRALTLAQRESRLLKPSFVGTEHLLLGLIGEGEGVAARVLESLGISLETAREKVKETIGQVDGTPSESPPFTTHSKKALELALRESLALGLVREGGDGACQMLVSMGARLDDVRESVIQRRSGYRPSDAEDD